MKAARYAAVGRSCDMEALIQSIASVGQPAGRTIMEGRKGRYFLAAGRVYTFRQSALGLYEFVIVDCMVGQGTKNWDTVNIRVKSSLLEPTCYIDLPISSWDNAVKDLPSCLSDTEPTVRFTSETGYRKLSPLASRSVSVRPSDRPRGPERIECVFGVATMPCDDGLTFVSGRECTNVRASGRRVSYIYIRRRLAQGRAASSLQQLSFFSPPRRSLALSPPTGDITALCPFETRITRNLAQLFEVLLRSTWLSGAN